MQFDVVVVGGGHAGTEAAAAAARRGAKTALISFDPALIGAMSCNPAIGGVGKGHIVREVDAFDGLIARAADSAAIHYRMLNRSKGVAVHGPRVQADRRRYAAAIQAMLAVLPSLSIAGGEVDDLIVAGRRISGVRMADGSSVTARAVVLATGTFLGGRIFRGEEREEGGRVRERAATRLGQRLRALGLPISRLKTGTPPRLDGRTIDWGALAEQPSDDEDWRMSPLSGGPRLPQLSCAITRTNARTHDIIRASLDRSPLFSGAIGANGPRYCPSIEDKIHRFGDREGHQIFLEPEGLDDHLVYPNGISTSLPTDVQEAMVRSIQGLADVAIGVPGYAVEYDYIDPRSLDMRLHLSAMEGLFCAGQINGTTGYEEAAGQGLVAGLNAAAYACDLNSVVLDRSTSYLGVMVDDLVLQGVTEPYRMLTARAEHRLRLRADNAEARLGVIAQQAGCLGESRIARYRQRADERAALEALFSAELTAAAVASRGGVVAQDGSRRSARMWLRGEGIVPELLVDPSILKRQDGSLLNEFVEDARYAPYLERLDAELADRRFDSEVTLNAVDYRNIPGLSNEMVERLQIVQPETLEAASRVRGVSPAALSAILLHVKRGAAA